MAIVYENSTQGSGFGAVTISSFSAGSNADRIVIVQVQYESGTGLQPSTVTYGGVSMTRLGYETSDSNSHCLFYLTGAETSGDIVTDSDNGSNRKSVLVGAWSGVGAVSGYTAYAVFSTSFSMPITSATGHTAVAFGMSGNIGSNSRITPGTGVTEHLDADISGRAHYLCSKAGEATTNIEGSYGTANYHQFLGLSLEPAGGGGSSAGAAAHYYRQMQ